MFASQTALLASVMFFASRVTFLLECYLARHSFFFRECYLVTIPIQLQDLYLVRLLLSLLESLFYTVDFCSSFQDVLLLRSFPFFFEAFLSPLRGKKSRLMQQSSHDLVPVDDATVFTCSCPCSTGRGSSLIQQSSRALVPAMGRESQGLYNILLLILSLWRMQQSSHALVPAMGRESQVDTTVF